MGGASASPADDDPASMGGPSKLAGDLMVAVAKDQGNRRLSRVPVPQEIRDAAFKRYRAHLPFVAPHGRLERTDQAA
jgi:hypothetical protein